MGSAREENDGAGIDESFDAAAEAVERASGQSVGKGQWKKGDLGAPERRYAAAVHPTYNRGSHALRWGTVRALVELPGWEIVGVGLSDLAQGRRTIPALVVSIGAPRLRQLGFEVVSPIDEADHVLYQLLAEEDSDAAHGRYNALVRRLVSFERAASCAS